MVNKDFYYKLESQNRKKVVVNVKFIVNQNSQKQLSIFKIKIIKIFLFMLVTKNKFVYRKLFCVKLTLKVRNERNLWFISQLLALLIHPLLIENFVTEVSVDRQ